MLVVFFTLISQSKIALPTRQGEAEGSSLHCSRDDSTCSPRFVPKLLFLLRLGLGKTTLSGPLKGKEKKKLKKKRNKTGKQRRFKLARRRCHYHQVQLARGIKRSLDQPPYRVSGLLVATRPYFGADVA